MTPRRPPRNPVPGIVFHDLRVGDRVRVTISGRTGTIVRRLDRHNGFRVRWDEPVFGVIEGRVAWSNLEPADLQL